MKLDKKIFAAAMVAALLLPAIAFGQNATSTASTTKKDNIRERLDVIKAQSKEKRDALKEEVSERKGDLKSELQERRDDSREKANDNIKKRLEKFLDKMIERYEAAIDRLEKLSDRIDSRIEKFEAQGSDMTESKNKLATANIKINLAASSTAALKLKIENILSSTTASTTASTTDLRAQFKDIQNNAEGAKRDIKAAHAALVDVINSLKPGRNRKATSTPATTTPATTTATTTP